jgi:predicted ribonuclease YlaK
VILFAWGEGNQMTLFETNSKILSEHTYEAQLTHFKQKRENKKKKRQQVIKEQDGSVTIQKQHLTLYRISPITDNQKLAFQQWEEGQNLLLHGLAGTGKSFVSLYLALREIYNPESYYKRILIVRSVVPTRDMGFLPGNIKEKTKVFELPYQGICSDLFGRGDAYELLKNKKLIDFTTTSFIRGNTFHDTIVIVDEVNNLNFHELDSVITRLGDNCRIMLCGDYRQSDLVYHNEKEGLPKFMGVLDRMSGFAHIEFGIDDIVRSGLVKQYIIAKSQLGIT